MFYAIMAKKITWLPTYSGKVTLWELSISARFVAGGTVPPNSKFDDEPRLNKWFNILCRTRSRQSHLSAATCRSNNVIPFWSYGIYECIYKCDTSSSRRSFGDTRLRWVPAGVVKPILTLTTCHSQTIRLMIDLLFIMNVDRYKPKQTN